MTSKSFAARLGLVACFTALIASGAALATDKKFTVQSAPVTSIVIPFSVDGAAQWPGTTNFDAFFENGSMIELDAPATWQNRPFVEWQRNGVSLSTDPTLSFSLGAFYYIYTAVYGPPKVKLDVTSSPDTGIEFRNEDIYYFNTPYEREFDVEDPYEAIVRAPEEYNGKPFSRWLLDGEPASTFHIINVLMDDNHSLEAQFGSGTITCKIQPKDARKKARWRIDGGPWMKKGATVSNLTIGDHLLEWLPVTGFRTPRNRTVPIADGDNFLIRGRYFPLK